MTTARSYLRLGVKHIVACLAAAGLLLRLVAPALVAPISSPLDALWSPAALAALGYEVCSHAALSGADGEPERPAPQDKRAHHCMACCAPASLAGAPPTAFALPVWKQTRIDRRYALTPATPALSIHVVRQRGPPPA